jgi:hypothetical protein
MPAPEYDRFEEEARAAIAEQQALVARQQEAARRFLEASGGTEGRDVREGEPNG